MRDINHLVSNNKKEAFAFVIILKTGLHQCYITSFSSRAKSDVYLIIKEKLAHDSQYLFYS